jgi:hypothetical protein
MPIDIYIDHNVWDLIIEKQIDLGQEFPKEQFALHKTREAEFEIPPTPENKRAKIEATIARDDIDTICYFGLDEPQHISSEQRVGGFDVGTIASIEELNFINLQRSKLGKSKKPKTGLYKNEADISLAARSFHSVVLTLDKKPGPLKDAHFQGGIVVFLTNFDEKKLSLREFVLSEIREIRKCS